MTRPLMSAARGAAVALIVLLPMSIAASPAAAATRADKLAVLAGWTQTSAASAAAWSAARIDRKPWASYGFDWSTDTCSASPDRPLGFNFAQPCRRHDFGYRNYRAAALFRANKARVDNAFLADLRRVCGTYAVPLRPACLSLAWTYYQAVHLFGSLVAVTSADLRHAERLRADGLRAAR